MTQLKQLTPQQAATVCLEDIMKDQVRLKKLQTIHTAYHTSDKDEYGKNLFGSDGVVGMYIVAQVYHIVPFGSSTRIDRELQEKVYSPLGFELIADPQEEKNAGLNFYNHLGRGITQQPQL